MRTITLDNRYDHKELQQSGEKWRCISCDASHATSHVTWRDHRDTVIFDLRYCHSCVPAIFVEPPLEQRSKLPKPTKWALNLSSDEELCDACGCPVDFWDGLTGSYVLCPAHRNRRGRVTAFWRRITHGSHE